MNLYKNSWNWVVVQLHNVMWKNVKFSLIKKIFRQINSLVTYLFSKTVTFTKFLPKMRERIPVISTLWFYGFYSSIHFISSRFAIVAINFTKNYLILIVINYKLRVKPFTFSFSVNIGRRPTIFTENYLQMTAWDSALNFVLYGKNI